MASFVNALYPGVVSGYNISLVTVKECSVTQKRPVFLNLLQIKFPITAIISILHRVTGVVIFLSLPLLLWTLQASLRSKTDFTQLQECLMAPICKVIVWFITSVVIYHVLAGLRHIIMDVGYAESLKSAKSTAYITLFLSIVFSVYAGVFVW
jgi:succinate dehydrogenase / fumarate reductase, cytochrome b subunit